MPRRTAITDKPTKSYFCRHLRIDLWKRVKNYSKLKGRTIEWAFNEAVLVGITRLEQEAIRKDKETWLKQSQSENSLSA